MELNIINKFHAKEEKCLKKLIVNWILAWSLLCDCCAKLIEYIKDIILSDHFISLHKQKPSLSNAHLLYDEFDIRILSKGAQ
jgi:hypothetical protein